MPLLGNAAILVLNDLKPGLEREHDGWHSYQHLPERLGVPGFLRARRAIGEDPAKPRVFVLYELETLAAATSAAYLERLNNPTDWTHQSMSWVRRLTRMPAHVIASLGRGGVGSQLITVWFSPQANRAAELRQWLLDDVLGPLARAPTILGVHLLEKDESSVIGSSIEQSMRGRDDASADSVLLLEGYDAEALRAACASRLLAAVLSDHGAIAIETAEYRLGHVMTQRELIGPPEAMPR